MPEKINQNEKRKKYPKKRTYKNQNEKRKKYPKKRTYREAFGSSNYNMGPTRKKYCNKKNKIEDFLVKNNLIEKKEEEEEEERENKLPQISQELKEKK